MCRRSENLVTKRQLEQLFSRWECAEPIPKKDEVVFVAFPKRRWRADAAECKLTSLKDPENEPLYQVSFLSNYGRHLDATIQECHVIAYRETIGESI